MVSTSFVRVVAIFCLSISALFGVTLPASNRYALILDDTPVAGRFASRAEMRTAQAVNYRAQMEARQRTLKAELRTRSITVTGSTTTVLNAVFVIASPGRKAELESLPGVKAVVSLRFRKMNLNTAVGLVNAPAAWSSLGGQDNAGKGVRIAILDTGVDSKHPAFQDSSLSAPSGFPKCSGGTFDCSAFTNNKVIVARSYVSMIAAGSASDPASDSRPDDYTPRDRVGHGTATASCAAAVRNTGLVTFTGVAPKAYIGNYKITGSPGVNDGSPDDAILQALEDAVNDGMDVISFSFGGPALTGPLDTGSICGNPAGVPCDPVAYAFENAAHQGVALVASGGNEGDSVKVPTYNTIDSPANAPSVIGVGGVSNSHQFVGTLSVPGGPSSLQNLTVDTGDSSGSIGALTAVLRDAASVGDQYACSAFPLGAFAGTIALIERGPRDNACTFTAKVSNALNAGAVGVVLYNYDPELMSPGGVSSIIPVVMLSGTDGQAVKNYIGTHPNQTVTIDPNATEHSATPNQILSFSSAGPTTGGLLKPDVVAPGGNIYMAAQSYDPLGILYSSSGYAVASGTSFSAPIVAGGAALVKQKHSDFSGQQIKSAVVNTATLTGLDTTDVRSVGAGEMDANAAVNTAVTAVPSTISFGIISSATPATPQTVTITNKGGSAVTVAASAAVTQGTAGAPSLNKQSLTLAPGASDTLTVSFTGAIPAPNLHAGTITLSGSGVSLRIPYQLAVADTTANASPYIISLTGDGFDGPVGQVIPDGIVSLKVADENGVPLAGLPVSWAFTSRRVGSIPNSDSETDANGVAAAQPILGSEPGTYSIRATVQGVDQHTFTGIGRPIPTIPSSASVTNAATGENTIAPGSYISIYGSDLSDYSDVANTATPFLPLSIDDVNVSFDVPSAGLSVPGHLSYVSPTQVNVHVPWELQGQTSAKIKVTIYRANGNVVEVPISAYAPAFFETDTNTVAALDGANKVINSSNPVTRGQLAQLYVNGLGPVTNQPASGDPAPSSPLAETKTKPIVTVGGQQAEVQFSGLAPGFAGLYQVNIMVPTSVSTGTQPLVISIGGKTSKTSGIAVK